MEERGLSGLPLMVNLKAVAEQNNSVLRRIFKEKIRGYFLIDIKNLVLEALGWENLIKYYDFSWSEVRMITGIGEAAEFDICRMIVGIHRSHSIFLSDDQKRKNEKSKRYKRQIVCETIEKIKMRFYGSIHFRQKTLLLGEEFLYYPLPYELFVILNKMSKMLTDGKVYNCEQLYYGVIYNSISALSLLEDNLFGTAYPLCRGAIEMYIKLLVLKLHAENYQWYEEFRRFEIEQSCKQTYPEKFNELFKKRICQSAKIRADYLHFGWVDFIGGYHNIVKKSPYSVYGNITFLKNKNMEKNFELEKLENFYKSCHAYTHGSIQISKYPVLHYFEISIMLYYVVRQTFLMLCREKKVEAMIESNDIISMIDRDFNVLCDQYNKRSTESFELYYHSASSEIL